MQGVGTMSAMSAMAAEPREALLELSINGVDRGTVRVIVRDDALLIAEESLRLAGVGTISGARETIGGIVYLDSGKLDPRLKIRYDEENLALIVTADPRLLESTTIDLAESAPRNLEFVDSTSAFVNYALTSENARTPTFISEQGVRFGGALLADSFAVTKDGRFIRSNTSLSFDNPRKSTRIVVGDSISEGGALGGVTRFGGVGYATAFGLNPYFTPFPNQRFAGVVSTPSTADIYINGRQVRSVEIPPGTFNLENLPGVTGAGNIRVVVRNAFGQSQELGTPYYSSTQLLRAGLHDFAYALGFERDPDVSEFGTYRGAVLSLRHRYGLSNAVSVGGFAALNRNKVVAGPEVAFSSPLGTLGLSATASRQARRSGTAASLQYSYQSARFSLGTSFTYLSREYVALGLSHDDDRALTRLDAYLAVPVTRTIDLSLDLSHARFRDAGVNDRISVTTSARLGSNLNLALTLSHAKFSRTPANTSVFLALSVPFGRGGTATASIDADRRGTTEAIQIQKSRPYGEGVGYLVQGAVGQNAASLADVQYQGRYGLYEVSALHASGQDTVRISASGALVAIGGRVLPTRPVQDAYALVRVPGLADVTATLSHQSVGKTDSRGDVFVPNLLPYYGNEVGIDDQDIPLGYTIGQTDRTVAPGYRGGAIVAFPVKKLQAFVGTLEVVREGQSVVPAYGELFVSSVGKTVQSPIGSGGEFYLEEVPATSSTAEIRYPGGTCGFAFNVPLSQERFIQMGKLSCVQH